MITPERKGASRLGWLILMGYLLGIIMTCGVGTASLGAQLVAGLMLGVVMVSLESRMYRWVTAPERPEETQEADNE